MLALHLWAGWHWESFMIPLNQFHHLTEALQRAVGRMQWDDTHKVLSTVPGLSQLLFAPLQAGWSRGGTRATAQGEIRKASWRQLECLEWCSKEFGVYRLVNSGWGVGGIGGMAWSQKGLKDVGGWGRGAPSKNQAKVEWFKQQQVVDQVKCQRKRRETGDRLGH